MMTPQNIIGAQWIAMLFLGLLLAWKELAYYLAERRWAKERSDLCKLIKAGTLGEYTQHKAAEVEIERAPEQPEKEESKPEETEPVEEIDLAMISSITELVRRA